MAPRVPNLELNCRATLSALHNRIMDDVVTRALAKWPHVPACFGWLGLDARGRWYLRDAATQNRGNFEQARGDWLRHPGLIDFIGRNYLSDAKGQWYFQNGPQRVYVELEAAPWIWRVAPEGTMVSHTGQQTQACQTFCDDEGRLYAASLLGLGLVHSLDVVVAADLIGHAAWPAPETVPAVDLQARFGYVRSPGNSARQLRPGGAASAISRS